METWRPVMVGAGGAMSLHLVVRTSLIKDLSMVNSMIYSSIVNQCATRNSCVVDVRARTSGCVACGKKWRIGGILNTARRVY